MAGFPDRMLIDDAVYWAPPVNDGVGGMTFAAGVAIKCKWRDINEVFVNAQGEERVTRSVVSVDRAVEPGGYLFKGVLGDLACDGKPFAQGTNALRIEGYKRTTSLDGNRHVRKAML